MTDQTIRPEYWKDGDFLYTGGRWLVMTAGQWVPVPSERGEQLNALRKDQSTTTYVTPSTGGEVFLWDWQPSPEERAAVEAQYASATDNTGLTDEEQEFADQFGDTAKGFSTEQEALAVLGNDPNYVIGRNTQGRYIIKPKPRVTKESSFATRPEAEAALGNDPDYEIGRSTDGRYTIKPKPKTATQSQFKTEAEAQQYAQALGNFAYVMPDDRGGFKVVVDEAQRRQSMEQQPLRSFDDMIMGAINEGDLARAFQIDQIRDLMGVDRVSLANNVMAFYLENEDANVLQGYRDGTRPIPPMLQQAMDIYRQALSPTGGLNLQMVQQQNAQGPSWMEMAQMYVAAGGVVTRDQNGKPLAEPITQATYPQSPQLYGKLTLNPETGKYEYPNISPPTPTDAEGRFDPAAANRRYAEQNPNSIQAQYQRDAPIRQAADMAETDEEALQAGRIRSEQSISAPMPTDRFNQQGGIQTDIDPAGVGQWVKDQRTGKWTYTGGPQGSGVIDEATGEPRISAQPQPAMDIDEATGEPRNAPSPVMANAKARYEEFRRGNAAQGIQAQSVRQASQNSGYYGAEWDEDVNRPEPVVAQQSQSSLANRDIIDPYLTAARKRQQQRRRRTPIYTG